MIYQVGKKQCSNSGRKRNDIDSLESDFIVQPPSPLEFPGPLTPPPAWNFQFPPWWESGYFLEPHIVYIVGLPSHLCSHFLQCWCYQAGGQEAAVIMGQTQIVIVTQLLGLEKQDLVMPLTNKETVSIKLIKRIFKYAHASVYYTTFMLLT